jgi:predicted RNA-binding Zn-ribbon protein involved in translation (DUF1610 family)
VKWRPLIPAVEEWSDYIVRLCKTCGHNEDPVRHDQLELKNACPTCGLVMTSRMMSVPIGKMLVWNETEEIS